MVQVSNNSLSHEFGSEWVGKQANRISAAEHMGNASGAEQANECYERLDEQVAK